MITPLDNVTSSSSSNTTTTANGHEKNSIYFVTSKVGHPMLVVDQYTFHKHSTNPKTNRINWRCSRRRVKEIRCSSSCYTITIDGVVSCPTPHDEKCFPISEAMLLCYQNKPVKAIVNSNVDSFVNVKCNAAAASSSFTLEENNINIKKEFIDCNNNNYIEEYCSNNSNNGVLPDEQEEDRSNYRSLDEEQDEEEQEPYKKRPRFQLLETRNKRKENLPTRSNENSDDMYEQFNQSNNNNSMTISNIISGIGGEQQQDDIDEIFYENDALDFGSNSIDNPNDEFDYYEDEIECDIANNNNDSDNNTPQTMSIVLSQLDDFKRKYVESSTKLRSANIEVDRLKRTSSMQIQTYIWKSKIMEMDMNSLKSTVQQKNVEICNLKKLVEEMMSKLKSD